MSNISENLSGRGRGASDRRMAEAAIKPAALARSNSPEAVARRAPDRARTRWGKVHGVASRAGYLWALLLTWPTALGAAAAFEPNQANTLIFAAKEARFIRLLIKDCTEGQPCVDELEVYAPDGERNLALAGNGGKATASSCLPGYAIHQVAHLNDGQYGNSHSWIAAGTQKEWAQIELPETTRVAKVVFSRDRNGSFTDRRPGNLEVQISLDGVNWETVARAGWSAPSLPQGPLQEKDLLRYAFDCENATWQTVDARDPVDRVLEQMEPMLARFEARGIETARERADLAALRQESLALPRSLETEAKRLDLYFRARLAKRQLFLREPQLAALERILFVKRHPYEPSHNYSVILDAAGAPGGGVCVLNIPRDQDRLDPGRAKLTVLFDATNGIARDPVVNFDARRVYFGYRQTKQDYFHLWAMHDDGSAPRELTSGPFHDFFPRPLPDGGMAFISTRCRARFLCWRPQAFVLFRMELDGSGIQPLSHANLSEWTPSLMNDGRILWMRSEYLDKGADFGHTLWAIRPDGTHPELIFGNNTLNCYAHGHEVPGTTEILCTLVSHGGDLNGPIALIDPAQGRSNPQAIHNLTPDTKPRYHMDWARKQCFRDPVPISQDYFLCSHAPADKFGLYVIDRYGNRELLYLDPAMGSMSPTLLRPSTPPPILPRLEETLAGHPDLGQFIVADVYQGLEPVVKRGAVKYLRVCQELRSDLKQLPSGEYQNDHEAFEDWYASPTHKVKGPNGWPSYVAKSNLGTAPVEEDGSANFYAPSGKVLYFQALDKDYNELQRMRSVVQLQPGEQRSCVGCHEPRLTAPRAASSRPLALKREPSQLQPPPWGAGPFAYEQVVQPVWDAKCSSCHDAKDSRRINLTASRDVEGVPASYRMLIEQGWVHYFDYTWGQEHRLAEPMTFGTLQSKLWPVLDAGHHGVVLNREEMQRIKCWIDLNCPLWPDYRYRLDRLKLQTVKN